ncbi:MAG: hemerythrin domain-containing protein [Betaproteobacteria bacterium]|nr:hemerythrin domain-containing protein [Betaproteobacteria bacterium]MDE2309516.1 hemerythrin domain-containing protein [Betaproteobacteria bacterium]
MKRCSALRTLSNEHHHGLVLATRAKKAAGTEAAGKAWQQIQVRFAAEMEPHFQAEEMGLLPALERVGETELVRRTHADHAELRRMIREGGVQAMTGFAELLIQHIRFEERELFETAQQKIPAAELDTLAN